MENDFARLVEILEETIDTWETIARQRDIPQTYLHKLDRLRVEAAEARAAVGQKIDDYKAINPRESKHGELA